jgi:surfactin synthase thioesterase subunit
MKLVLLPGLDGTGFLFEEFIANCQYECLIIQLPEDGEQNHIDLAKRIINQLPDEDYVLLAESYSGGLMPYLIQNVTRKPEAVVLVASFLHAPRPLVISFLCQIPLKALMSFPSAKSIIKFMCMKGATNEQFNQFWNLLNKLDFLLMKRRLIAIKEMIYPADKVIDIPTLGIIAKHDKLVPRYISNKLINIFSRLTIETMDGPHFVLQVKAKEAVGVIHNFIENIRLKNHV